MKHDHYLGIFTAALLAAYFVSIPVNFRRHQPEPTAEAVPHHSAMALLRAQHQDNLTDWQMLQLAIIYTESRFDPDALGSSQDAGLYQMTPVYVAEVNRVAGTDYAHEDAFDPDKAVAMFAAMQQHYNPERDIETAIRYHNRGAAYRRAVLDNYELLRRYEAARKAVTAK